jgi:archaemetzincin
VKVIFLIPMGDIDPDILESVSMSLWHTFGIEIRKSDPMDIPHEAFDGKRNQYSSIDILQGLHKSTPKDVFRVLAITDKDLFIPVLSFVYGHAQFEGKVGIVSIARLRQSYYGFPEDPQLLTERTVKEVIHETGHMFGLTHCNDMSCPMTLSTNIRMLDRKGPTLCANCILLLKENMVEKFQ